MFTLRCDAEVTIVLHQRNEGRTKILMGYLRRMAADDGSGVVLSKALKLGLLKF